MKNMLHSYRTVGPDGTAAVYTLEIVNGPEFLGGNKMIVMITQNREYLKMVDISHDDWALDDFGAWCEDYITRALNQRIICPCTVEIQEPPRLKTE